MVICTELKIAVTDDSNFISNITGDESVMEYLEKYWERSKNNIFKIHKVDNRRFWLKQQYETKKISNVSNQEAN